MSGIPAYLQDWFTVATWIGFLDPSKRETVGRLSSEETMTGEGLNTLIQSIPKPKPKPKPKQGLMAMFSK